MLAPACWPAHAGAATLREHANLSMLVGTRVPARALPRGWCRWSVSKELPVGGRCVAVTGVRVAKAAATPPSDEPSRVQARTMSATLHVLLAVLIVALRFAAGAAAQEAPSGTSYLTPFPEGDTYKLQAYGDAFAEGLIEGLNEAFAGDRRIQVARKHRPLAGIARADFDGEMKAEEASKEPLHI